MAQIFTYLEIGTLKERQFTGISQVTSEIAAALTRQDSCQNFFFYGQTIIDRDIVVELLRQRDGGLLDWHVAHRAGRPAPFAADGTHVGIFPNRKTVRRAFNFEVQIVHDLSTLLTPQFHHEHTVEYHAPSLEGDIASNDLTVCVSNATRDDVIRYIPPPDPTSVVTIHNAASIDPTTPAEREVDGASRPSVVVLGTIEPRKNVGQVLEVLQESPSLAETYHFIFLGRYGWGASVDDLLAQYGLQQQRENGLISFPGFVSESRKNAYLAGASLLIYPSLFEGFGLPIVEAMAFGVPCITTASSSMPEVGGDACFYFDPFEAGDFRRTLLEALMAVKRSDGHLADRCRAQAAKFSWAAAYESLSREITSRVRP